MKKMFSMFSAIVVSTFLLIGNAMADYRLIIPSPQGTGTSIWGQTVAAELEKYLGEKIIVEHIKGAKGNLGLNTFNEKYKGDKKTIVLAHGGNADAWLIEDVKWSFYDWDPVLIQPYNITTTIKKGFDWQNEKLSLADCGGCVPETLAWAVLKGWDNINFIRKMSPGEAKQAWLRGEFNYIREPVSRHIKNTLPMVESGEAVRLFNHGLFTMKGFEEDPNWPDTPSMTKLYEETFGKKPSGDIYDAYVLATVWREGMQKGLYMHKGANTKEVTKAFKKMMKNKESREYLESKLGKYPMYFGKDAHKVLDSLYSYVTKDSLKALVDFASEKMQWSTAVYVESKAK
tara:strand:+ start:2186 stop:3217 length:1032 start_codon:yes stop_codon:yes gene_type:complete